MTRRRSPLTLSHIVERIAGVCPPQHRELTRGMVAELASIANPAERTRFALGAIAAIARLAVRGYCRTIAHAPGLVVGVREPEYRTNVGGRSMQRITTPQLLRRHAVPFAISFASLMLLALAIQAVRRQRRQFDKRRTGIDELRHALARQQLAAVEVALGVFFTATFAGLGERSG